MKREINKVNNLLYIPDDDPIMIESLESPVNPRGIVLIAHGRGSSRFSSRKNDVARELHQHGFMTLLMDLLTPEEDTEEATRFNIALLAHRLEVATFWLEPQPQFNS